MISCSATHTTFRHKHAVYYIVRYLKHASVCYDLLNKRGLMRSAAVANWSPIQHRIE